MSHCAAGLFLGKSMQFGLEEGDLGLFLGNDLGRLTLELTSLSLELDLALLEEFLKFAGLIPFGLSLGLLFRELAFHVLQLFSQVLQFLFKVLQLLLHLVFDLLIGLFLLFEFIDVLFHGLVILFEIKYPLFLLLINSFHLNYTTLLPLFFHFGSFDLSLELLYDLKIGGLLSLIFLNIAFITFDDDLQLSFPLSLFNQLELQFSLFNLDDGVFLQMLLNLNITGLGFCEGLL
jgi:hypothetical protein